MSTVTEEPFKMECPICNNADVPEESYCCTACETKLAASDVSLIEASDSPADIQMLEAARVLFRQAKLKEAIAFYEKASRRMPHRVDVHRELCGLLLSQALIAWLPWERKRIFMEADKAARHAISLGDNHGDSYFVLAEASGWLGKDVRAVFKCFQWAMNLYEEQLLADEPVGVYFLTTAIRIAQRSEVEGDYYTALNRYNVWHGAEDMERAGKIPPGAVTPEFMKLAQAGSARLEAIVFKGEEI